MATINGMPPGGLSATTPINSNTMGNTVKSNVSGSFQGASQQEMAQKIEQKKADIAQLKLQETVDLPLTQNVISSTELDLLLQNLNTELKQLQNYMKFERDQDSQNMVIVIKDRETDELIRQIPSEEFLTISKNITQFLEMQKQLAEKISPPVGMLTDEMA